mmetsp:Transcript_15083/g.17073  ORF Transcript_15083/g.17073 Transcript_15083/m.17073 type:complete len:392 (-) Transcript_15083:125-1300(-)
MACLGCASAPLQADLTPFEPMDTVDTAHIFVMVNPTSGGNKAGEILNLKLDFYRLNDKTWVWMFNMMDSESRSAGFDKLRTFQKDPRAHPSIIACGGDGTVKWVVSELERVECLDIPIGVIPFGTGNDFARVCGWGGFAPKPLIGKQMRSFNKTMNNLLNSQTCKFDVWKIEILLKNNGEFWEIKNKREELCSSETKEKIMVHQMINYFSIGADANIAFEFAKNRKRTQLGNKLEYVRQGLKQLVNAPPKLRSYIEKIQSNETELPAKLGRKFLVWQNIGSYGGGMDIWGKNKSSRGMVPQQFGDELLELMSVISPAYVPASKFSGRAGIRKVSQQDNYSITFKDSWDQSVYFQVDGEGYRANGIRAISISRDYQVQVLRKGGKNQVSMSL